MPPSCDAAPFLSSRSPRLASTIGLLVQLRSRDLLSLRYGRYRDVHHVYLVRIPYVSSSDRGICIGNHRVNALLPLSVISPRATRWLRSIPRWGIRGSLHRIRSRRMLSVPSNGARRGAAARCPSAPRRDESTAAAGGRSASASARTAAPRLRTIKKAWHVRPLVPACRKHVNGSRTSRRCCGGQMRPPWATRS